MRGKIWFSGLLVAIVLASAGKASAADFSVSAICCSTYVINGQSNPNLTLTRGQTYTFAVAATNHPFYVKTAQVLGAASTFDTGVTNNGTESGTLTFVVPTSAPATLFYQCGNHMPMTGLLSIVSPAAVPAGGGVTRGVLGIVIALAGYVAIGRVRRRMLTRRTVSI